MKSKLDTHGLDRMMFQPYFERMKFVSITEIRSYTKFFPNFVRGVIIKRFQVIKC